MPQTSMPVDGKEIVRRREHLAMTQALLAQALDVHPDTISKVEQRNKASMKTIRKLAKFFKCDPADLFIRETEGAA
jgi:DNA-binding XRE family transcriptional regulator